MKKKKCSFTKSMHYVTSWSQRWQNYMNCTSNYFCTHPFFQNWPPATTGCLQTTKECSWERDLAPMEKWYRKLRRILRPKTNCSTKKASNCSRSVGRRLCWWIKSNFAKQLFYSLSLGLIEWWVKTKIWMCIGD